MFINIIVCVFLISLLSCSMPRLKAFEHNDKSLSINERADQRIHSISVGDEMNAILSGFRREELDVENLFRSSELDQNESVFSIKSSGGNNQWVSFCYKPRVDFDAVMLKDIIIGAKEFEQRFKITKVIK